jgi:hypothetical protein
MRQSPQQNSRLLSTETHDIKALDGLLKVVSKTSWEKIIVFLERDQAGVVIRDILYVFSLPEFIPGLGLVQKSPRGATKIVQFASPHIIYLLQIPFEV